MTPANQIFQAFTSAAHSAQLIKEHEAKYGGPAQIIFFDGKGRHPVDQSEPVDQYAIRNLDGSYDYDMGA